MTAQKTTPPPNADGALEKAVLTERAATPIAFVHAILLAYQRYKVDPTAALQKAQITPAMLRRAGATITASQMEVISDAAMRELDDEALGWFSRRLPWGSSGLLCRAALGSPTLAVALKRWCRHHRLLTDDLLLDFSAHGHEVTITLTERRRFGALREFCLLTSLRYLHGFACWAIDSRVPVVRVSFPFAAPAHHAVYPRLFPGPVSFSAAQASLTIDAGYLALPLRRDERALRLMLQRALPLTVRPYRRDRLLVQRVREVLGGVVRGGVAAGRSAAALTAAEVAERLHVSVRTLHRQLHDEGAALQTLKDEVRRDLALSLLQRSATPVKQIAGRVGFRSEKSFLRAFKQWTGTTPGACRAGA